MRFTVLIMLGIVLAAPGPTQDLVWYDLDGSATLPGGLSNSPEQTQWPALTTDTQDRPWVFFGENVQSRYGLARELRLWRWAGGEWQRLESSALNVGQNLEAYTLIARFSPQNELFLAWLQRRIDSPGTSGVVAVRSLRDGQWRSIGFPTPANFRGTMRMEMVSQVPYIVLKWASVPGRSIQVFRNGGNSWTELGPEDGSGIIPLELDVREYSVAARVQAVAVVTRSDEVPQSLVHVLTWDGQNWVSLGPGIEDGAGINTPGTWGSDVSLTSDAENRLCVSWFEGYPTDPFASQIHVRVWQEDEWRPLGAPAGSAEAIALPVPPETLVVPSVLKVASEDSMFLQAQVYSFTPSVEQVEERVATYRWNGSIWIEELFQTAPRNGAVLSAAPGTPSLVLDSRGLPAAGWSRDGEVFAISAGPGLYLDGDVNVDGRVDAADLVAAVNALMSEEPLARISEINLDLDGDEAITQADVDLLLALLLGGGG